MFVDKDGSPLGKLSERLAVLPVRKARRKELSALVDRAVKIEEENATLKRGIERLEFLSHMQSGIPTTADDRLCLIGEEADALLADTQESAEEQFASSLSKRTDPLTDDEKSDALLKDGWVLDENQQWRKVEKGKYV